MNKTYHNDNPLWQPSKERSSTSVLRTFMRYATDRWGIVFDGYNALHTWSIEYPEQFWETLWHFFPLIVNHPYTQVRRTGQHFWQTRWFEGARLNFAENILADARENTHTALHFISERGDECKLSYAQVYTQVSLVAQALRRRGVQAGDRVVAYMPNIPETIIAMLATTSLGAIWSSCSCEFGAMGVKDRFLQIKPKVIFTSDGYTYKGKSIRTLQNLIPLMDALDNPKPLVVVVPYVDGYDGNIRNNMHTTATSTTATISPTKQGVEVSATNKSSLSDATVSYATFIAESVASHAIEFVACNANDPLYILFSSGTVGAPKAIVHGIIGTLVQHLKELALHCNLTSQDTIFFYTTCGWMMWNWVVSALFFKATLVLYEGNPFYPNVRSLLDIAKRTHITIFGAGARYYQELQKNRVAVPKSLPALQTVLSTGSPLSPESFRYIYSAIKSDIQVSSISGGTDIISCFVLGCPLLPVYEGEIQCKGLGMAVEVRDSEGLSVTNEKGELVCTSPFPSMPLYFWNDTDTRLYKAAYFDNPEIWTHGDYAEIRDHGGICMHGRSDSTLNPGGVRIGTAELYRALEGVEYVVDAVAIGHTKGHDSEILLFIVVDNADSERVDRAMQSDWKELKMYIRKQTSPRHVPSRIYIAPDIPRTLSGKTSERCVSDLIHKREPKNINALANPQSLAFFRSLSL